jgi:UDP-N-acetylglucosamine--N-acetylmuramyl-(pentapeptide) pyrophosphoryl-undecaprenol N-acetylglucosamine transferase
MKAIRLLLAGSHAGATAIAIIKEVEKQKLPWNLSWIGKKWATEERKSFTLEYNSFTKMGVKFYSLESGKIQTKFTRYTLLAFLMLPFGFIMAGYHVARIRPDIILTLGGAAGAEVSFWGWLFGIPVIVHEQTSAAGRANIFASKFANEVAISRESSEKYFGGKKVTLTGNPINPKIKSLKVTYREKPRTIFITGGSRGSKWINAAVSGILPDLRKYYQVTHQVGEGNLSAFPKNDSEYKVYGQIDPSEWLDVLSDADIVVSRSGANIVSELIALKKPSVLIPIPWTYNDEQTENAKYARDFGIAEILPQKDLTPAALKEKIDYLAENYSKIIGKVEGKASPDLNASKALVDLLKKYA